MRCKDIKEYIERYADKSLSASKHAAVENHLKACSDCASAHGKAADIGLILEEAALPPVPADLTAIIMADVKFAAADDEKQTGIFRAFIREWANAAPPARAAFAGVLLILVIAGIFMGKDLWNKPKSLTYADYPELDAFSAAQKGSLENTYLQIISLPAKGGNK